MISPLERLLRRLAESWGPLMLQRFLGEALAGANTYDLMRRYQVSPVQVRLITYSVDELMKYATIDLSRSTLFLGMYDKLRKVA